MSQFWLVISMLLKNLACQSTSSKNRTRTLALRKNLKNLRVGNTGPQGLKTLPFVSNLMKDNIGVIHFHIKYPGVQALVFVQITFEKCTSNFYFENSKVGIKRTIANL